MLTLNDFERGNDMTLQTIEDSKWSEIALTYADEAGQLFFFRKKKKAKTAL